MTDQATEPSPVIDRAGLPSPTSDALSSTGKARSTGGRKFNDGYRLRPRMVRAKSLKQPERLRFRQVESSSVAEFSKLRASVRRMAR